MKVIDYIIVGDGYAALFFAHQLLKNNKSFIIFSEGAKSASQISAGVINPMVLKKFTTFWKAQEQIDFLHKTLAEMSHYTGTNYFIDAPVYRIFHDENEQDLWRIKSQNDDLKEFLDDQFVSLDVVLNPVKSGKVSQSGRLDVQAFFSDLLSYFKRKNHLIEEKFDYSKIDILSSIYKNFTFSKIIFCEGMAVKNNPFFSEIPVIANKGHQIKVSLSQNLDQKITIKKKHFLFPLSTDEYFYGGTYDREQLHSDIDESAVDQLKKGLQEIYPLPFEIKEIQLGFRPTVKDRRPILGPHPEHKNLIVFNGLGARGILNGCYFSAVLFDHTENGRELPLEVSLARFGL